MFHGLNDIELEAPDDDDVAYDLVIAVANAAVGYDEIAAQLAMWH